MDVSYYQTLQVNKNATQEQIKQSYKKLALKHHPDKNTDKQSAKIKFRQISEAYAVLNDPNKRKNYDLFGKQGLEFEGMNFQQFAQDFAMFENFVDDLLGFNDFEDILSFSKKKGKKKGRGGRSKKKKNQKVDMGNLDQVMSGMMQMMMLQSMMQGEQFDISDLMNMDQSQIQKFMKNSQDFKNQDQFNEDQEDLTKQQYQILQFGQQNVQKVKVGKKKKKKTVTICKFDNMEIGDDQILLHFSEQHMKQFKEWRNNKK